MNIVNLAGNITLERGSMFPSTNGAMLAESCIFESNIYDFRSRIHGSRTNVITKAFRKPWLHLIMSAQIRTALQVPIYLVKRNLIGSHQKVGHVGYIDDFRVPSDKYVDPLGGNDDIMLAPDPTEENDGRENYRDRCREEFDGYSQLDLFGLYTHEYPHNSYFQLGESSPRIFIWVDKIMQYVEGDWKKYNVLTAQVILHELSHAIMDPYLNGTAGTKHHPIPLQKKFPTEFETMKEEGLANALSMILLWPRISWEERAFLKSFVEKQPVQYRVGLKYIDLDLDGIQQFVSQWVDTKICVSFSQSAMKEWLKKIVAFKIDLREMQLIDRGIVCPEELIRYNGNLYHCIDFAIVAVRDFLATSQPLTKNEVLKLFPSLVTEEVGASPSGLRASNSLMSRYSKQRHIINCCDGELRIRNVDIKRFVGEARTCDIEFYTF